MIKSISHFKESAVFKAKLSPNWQGGESGNLEINEKNVDNKPPETGILKRNTEKYILHIYTKYIKN